LLTARKQRQLGQQRGLHRLEQKQRHPGNEKTSEKTTGLGGLVGLGELQPVDSPEARGGLRDRAVAAAVGSRADGTPVVVVAAEGADLDIVPRAADTRAWHAPDAELVIVLPAGNVHPVTARLAARLARPATVLDIAPEWPR